MIMAGANNSGQSANPAHDLGLGDADRDRQIAQSTRRVVMASLGVVKDQSADNKRTRSIALAATLIVLLVLGPLVWHAVDNLISGDRFGDLTSEFSLWVLILCPAILAAALVAGWLRKR